MSIEFDHTEQTARFMLDAIAHGTAPTHLTFSGDRTRLRLEPRWTGADQRMAADMARHCP